MMSIATHYRLPHLLRVEMGATKDSIARPGPRGLTSPCTRVTQDVFVSSASVCDACWELERRFMAIPASNFTIG